MDNPFMKKLMTIEEAGWKVSGSAKSRPANIYFNKPEAEQKTMTLDEFNEMSVGEILAWLAFDPNAGTPLGDWRDQKFYENRRFTDWDRNV